MKPLHPSSTPRPTACCSAGPSAISATPRPPPPRSGCPRSRSTTTKVWQIRGRCLVALHRAFGREHCRFRGGPRGLASLRRHPDVRANLLGPPLHHLRGPSRGPLRVFAGWSLLAPRRCPTCVSSLHPRFGPAHRSSIGRPERVDGPGPCGLHPGLTAFPSSTLNRCAVHGTSSSFMRSARPHLRLLRSRAIPGPVSSLRCGPRQPFHFLP